MSTTESKNKTGRGKANEDKVKKNKKNSKKERKMKTKDFIKRNILVG